MLDTVLLQLGYDPSEELFGLAADLQPRFLFVSCWFLCFLLMCWFASLHWPLGVT